MGFKQTIKALARGFLDTLYPDGLACVACGAELFETKADGFCDGCRKELPFSANCTKVCERCGTAIENLATFCNRCQNTERAFEAARGAFVYEGHIPRLIRQFKFDGKKYLAKNFAAAMAETLNTKLPPRPYTIIPVPTHETARRARGYNQAEELARELCKITGAVMRPELLIKTTQTEKQVNLSAAERAKNLEGTFKAPDKAALKQKTVLLVDDVITTGATANECAKILKKAGASAVFVLTAAVVRFKPETE